MRLVPGDVPKYLKWRVHEWLAAISCISSRQSAWAVLTDGSHSSLPELSNINSSASWKKGTPARRGCDALLSTLLFLDRGAATAQTASRR